MTEYETPSGLVVHDRRHDRSTVGPDAELGRYVMYPAPQPGWPEGGWHSEAWSGWPVDWQTPPMEPIGGWSDGGAYGRGSWSGEGWGRHNPTWTKVSTAMSCVALNSSQVASFPVYGMRGDTPFVLPEWAGSPEPELYESWPAFMLGACNSLQLRGEVITLVTGRYASGAIARFITVNPEHVDVEWIDGRRVFTMAGEELPAADVLMVRYQTMPGRLRGITPLEWSASAMATASSLERYGAGLATRGGVPWAVLKTRGNISAKQAEDAQQRWVAASSRRDGAPAVLGNEWDLETLTLSPKDMALLELQEYSQRAICAAFGVPPFLVAVSMASGLTYTNAEALFFQHWTSQLRPLTNLLMSAWSRWLLPRGQRMEANPDRYTQPALRERISGWAELHGIVDPATGERAITVQEIRRAERLNPLSDSPAPSGAQTLTGYSMDGDA